MDNKSRLTLPKKRKLYPLYLTWTLVILIYVIPFFVDKPDGSLEIIWLLYLIPPVLFTIYYGSKGGIFAAVTGVAGLFLESIMELYELTFKREEYNPRNLMMVMAIALGISIVTVGFEILIKRLENTSKHLEFLAKHDTLTDLPNRRMFEEELVLSIHKVKSNKKVLALIVCDLDRFKYINDTMGHFTGDLVLVEVAQRLKDVLHQGGSLFRLGGDEFMFLSEIQNMQEATDLAQKIIFNINKPIVLNNLDIRVTASLGIAIYPEHGPDAPTLMSHADMAMYKAKELGKNGYSLFSFQLEEDILQRVGLGQSLKDALEKNEFVLYYQPQIDLKTGRIIGAEALIRWLHPQMGLIPPNKFIPMAEETGLIVPMGEWILHSAVQEATKWHESGYPLKIAVNISAMQLQRRNFVKRVQEIIWEKNFNPKYLELEITESVALLNPEEVIKVLTELRSLGIQIAIDDFGTGYSSFSYLKKYPVNSIKIDRFFIQGITIDPRDRAMLEAMLVMVRILNCRTVAEGVETSEQLELLKELKCDLVQGYYFSQPVPAEEFIDVLDRNNEG